MWKSILMYGAFAALAAASAARAQIPAQVQVQRPVRAQVQDSAAAQVPVSENDLRMARFFAGAALIRNTPLAGDADRARLYRELEAVCGVTGEDASVFLGKCRNNPAEWKRVNDLTIPILTELLVAAPGAAQRAAPRTKAIDRKKGKLWAGQ